MSTKPTVEYVTFQVAGQTLGIPVQEVVEVLPEQTIALVPLAPRAVAGLLNLRGQIVTAIDVRRKLALKDQASGSAHMNIVVSHRAELFSLVVDSVGDVMTMEQEAFGEPPATLSAEWKSCCTGVYRMKRGLLVVINVSALVDFERQEEPKTHDNTKGVVA